LTGPSPPGGRASARASQGRGWRAPAPIPISEGHRIVWVHSSQTSPCDAQAGRAGIEHGMQALGAVQARLASPRSQLKTRLAAERPPATRSPAPAPTAGRYPVGTERSLRPEKHGRPGEKTRSATEKTVFTLTPTSN
jgi:hypothetical protein